MLGLRGCRLGIAYPEITEMQARAIFEAVAEVEKSGIKVKTEIMIPLVGFSREMSLEFEIVHRVAKEVAKETNVKFKYYVSCSPSNSRCAVSGSASSTGEDAVASQPQERTAKRFNRTAQAFRPGKAPSKSALKGATKGNG
jgi:pyruvate,orthophosphate dikinase